MFSRSLPAIEDFNDWLGELQHPHQIMVPVNHEFFVETDPKASFSSFEGLRS